MKVIVNMPEGKTLADAIEYLKSSVDHAQVCFFKDGAFVVVEGE